MLNNLRRKILWSTYKYPYLKSRYIDYWLEFFKKLTLELSPPDASLSYIQFVHIFSIVSHRFKKIFQTHFTVYVLVSHRIHYTPIAQAFSRKF